MGEERSTREANRQRERPAAQAQVVVGLLASEGLPKQVSDGLAGELADELGKRLPDVEWRIETSDEPFAAPAVDGRELVQAVRRRRLREGWQLAICLTDLPLRAGHRPVTAHASPSDGVGLVSVPAFGPVAIERRVRDAVLRLVEGLLAESVAERGDASAHDGREARMGRRLEELASPLGHPRVRDAGTVRFATAVVRGNLRLLLGMVRANNPTRVIVRLSRALASALGTVAFSLASASVWQLADGMTWPRLVALTVSSVVADCLALVVAHHLWEHSGSPEEREPVVLFNVVTTLTLALGVLTLYVALLAITATAGGALIPPDVLGRQLGHPAGLGDYLQLAWLVSSLATIGSGLGSFLESDLAVREAAYRYHPDERTEAEVEGEL